MQYQKMPLYFYAGTTQVDIGSMIIYMSSDVVERYSSYTTWTTLFTQADTHITNLANTVNGIVGFPLMSKQTLMYSGVSSTYGVYSAMCTKMLNLLGLSGMGIVYDTSVSAHLSYKLINGATFQDFMGEVVMDTSHTPTVLSHFSGGTPYTYVSCYNTGNPHDFSFYSRVFPDDLFASDGSISNDVGIEFRVYGNIDTTNSMVTRYTLECRYITSATMIWHGATFNEDEAQATPTDVEDPFHDDNNDGGDGDNYDPEVDPTDFPDMPSIGAGNAGLITMYTPTLAQLQALGSFLWSGLFDINNFKKLFTDPMDCIIGLAIVPAIPSVAGSKNIKFGNVDSEVSASYLSTQYVSVNCGSIKIRKDIGSFLDYDTKISIFLPYIGFRELAATDVMDSTISVKYNVDVLTGSCAAFIKHSTRGLMYAYNGSCIANIPLSGTNYSGAIQNAVSTVASGVGVLAGMASGAAPVTAMSAVSMLHSAANTALNAKPTIQRSGNLGGSAGIMSGKKPFVIIARPNYSVPDYFQKYEGRVCNKTAKLGDLKGFTMVEDIHLDNIAATSEELEEIMSLLKGGVIL